MSHITCVSNPNVTRPSRLAVEDIQKAFDLVRLSSTQFDLVRPILL